MLNTWDACSPAEGQLSRKDCGASQYFLKWLITKCPYRYIRQKNENSHENIPFIFKQWINFYVSKFNRSENEYLIWIGHHQILQNKRSTIAATYTVYSYYHLKWWIQDFPEGCAPTYYLTNFSRKLQENKEILARGEHVPCAP